MFPYKLKLRAFESQCCVIRYVPISRQFEISIILKMQSITANEKLARVTTY